MTKKTEQNEEVRTFTPKKVAPKDLKKVVEEISSHPPPILLEEGPKRPQSRFFKGACKVCGGDITEKIVHEYNPMTGPPIIGPGSRQQYHYVSKGLYCTQCGVKYEFVPGEQQEEE